MGFNKRIQGFAKTGTEDARIKGAKGGAKGGKAKNPNKGMGSNPRASEYGKLGAQKRKENELARKKAQELELNS